MGLKTHIARLLKKEETMNDICEVFSNSTSTQCLSKQDIRELREYSTLAGNVKEVLGKFVPTPQKVNIILEGITHVVHWEELLFFFVLGWFLMPLIEIPYKIKQQHETSDRTNEEKPGQKKGYENSFGYIVAHHVSQMAKLAFVVYMVDIVKVVMQGMGFEFEDGGERQHAFANMIYLAWIVNRMSALKRYVLAKHTKSDPRDLTGQVQLVDRLTDAFLYSTCLYVIVDSVKEDMGAAARGFFALGSVGTLVVSLASQGLATQVFNGLFLASSNRIAVGDYVTFANGVSGTVIKLGWMETQLRGADEILMTVPNKDIADQRVKNLSRVQMCQVKQTLRFKYKDIDKIPKVLKTIKEEISKVCPNVINDGSRPFRAFMTGYHADHISAVVDAHFSLKPLGDPFWENQQNVLLAINKAVKDYNMEFAVVDVTAVSRALRVMTGTD